MAEREKNLKTHRRGGRDKVRDDPVHNVEREVVSRDGNERGKRGEREKKSPLNGGQFHFGEAREKALEIPLWEGRKRNEKPPTSSLFSLLFLSRPRFHLIFEIKIVGVV